MQTLPGDPLSSFLVQLGIGACAGWVAHTISRLKADLTLNVLLGITGALAGARVAGGSGYFAIWYRRTHRRTSWVSFYSNRLASTSVSLGPSSSPSCGGCGSGNGAPTVIATLTQPVAKRRICRVQPMEQL